MASGIFTINQVNQAIRQGAWSGYIAPTWVEYLVVAGGGGGGGGTGGGGGAGGLLTGIVSITGGTSYTVTVGSGGSGGSGTNVVGSSGVNSVFGSISTTGGGGGASNSTNVGISGGSGGGASFGAGGTGGNGVAGQGNAGGTGVGASYTPSFACSGGGGAGTVGLVGIASTGGGNGGAGIASAISGMATTYAGGGGGGLFVPGTASSGGVGGGGSSNNAGAGYAGGGNTGGGGGGGSQNTSGGAGGSGIVVVRYPGSVQFFTGGTLSYGNGYVIHTFYSSGTLAPTTPTPYIDSTYQISRSLRFNAPDSTYLNRTPASAGNQKTWTFSAWVKRGTLSGLQYGMFSCRNGAGGLLRVTCGFYSDDTWLISGIDSSNVTFLAATTVQVFRDPSAWYHFVIVVDTTQAVSTNRFKLYVNGAQVTALTGTTYPSQNTDTGINSTIEHNIGKYTQTGNYVDGYMTEINLIDGQALTPSSFGYTNPSTGVWSPVKFVGTYGTNGFYLNFSDNSNTTAATLGKDYSGNGNNWTPNNFSVSAGAGNDSLVDSPTSYGTDTGAGGTVRGNYCTINPLDGTSVSATSNGNLDFTIAANGGVALGTMAVSSGKWYWEVVGTGGDVTYMVGVANASAATSTKGWLGANGWFYYNNNGNKYTNSASSAYGATWTTGDVIGVALDMDAGSVTFYKNGTSQGTAYSVYSGLTMQPAVSSASGTNLYTINFGQRPFAYTAPSGYKALCTQNLPTPTIGATTATQAGKYYDANIYTGTGANLTITNSGFQPDLVWLKIRSASSNHVLINSISGYDKYLQSSSTAIESTSTDQFLSFNSNGFTLGANAAAGGNTNQSGSTYVGWQWKGGGTGVTNTAGSITSTVSANTTSGFSVVTYTGTSALATVGHGLGVAPSMIIVKSRNNAVDWVVYHASLGINYSVALNSTASAVNTANYWGSSAPTSTTFGVNVYGGNGASGYTYVAYCFAPIAGYSAMGSYTGNGSTDGPFVFTNMRPAFVLIRSTGSQGWYLYDVARGTYNVVGPYLEAQSSAAEGTATQLDILSNGFKIRESGAGSNTNGGTYIYMAFASNPFKYSLAR